MTHRDHHAINDSAAARGFRFSEGTHPNGSTLPWHWHDAPTICFVLDGAFTEICDGDELLCTPLTVKFMPAGARHCDRFDQGPARGLLIEIDPNEASALRPLAPALDRHAVFHGGPPAAIMARVHRELRRRDAATPLALEGLMLELIACASRLEGEAVRGRSPGWLEQARAMVHDSLGEHHGLRSIAAAVGVHPVTLARAFRRNFGRTVGEYVRHLRLESAIRDLEESRASLAAIALANGFSDQSHFSNAFRRHTGVTPSEYRRRIRR